MEVMSTENKLIVMRELGPRRKIIWYLRSGN